MKWESEFKKHLLRILQEFDPEIDITQVHIVGIAFPDIDLAELEVKDLARMYAFSIMREDYEQAVKIKEELIKKNCKISLDIDEKKKEGVLNIVFIPPTSVKNITVNLKVLKDGLCIDWDKEDI